MSTPSERAAERAAAREAKKAEREAEKAARKEESAKLREEAAQARSEMRAMREDIKISDDISVEEIVNIIASPDEQALKKQSAVAKISKDRALYVKNKELFHSRLEDIIANGGNILSTLVSLILEYEPKVFAPHVKSIVERLGLPSPRGPTNLLHLKTLSAVCPVDVYPYANEIFEASEGFHTNYRVALLEIYCNISKGKNIPAGGAEKMFDLLIKVLKMAPDNNDIMKAGLQRVRDMETHVDHKHMKKEMPFLKEHKDANAMVFTDIQNIMDGIRLEDVDATVKEHEKRLDKHEQWLKDQESRLNSLAKNFDISQEKMMEMTEKINNISGNEEQTSMMLGMLDQINSVMGETFTAKREEAELENLLAADPYNRAFYNSFRSELTATYLAAKSVQTDIVQNSKSGEVGAVGDVLQTASSYIPVIGAGVAFFGAVLSSVDANIQKRMVKRYADLAVDTDDMNAISRQVGAELIKNLDRGKVDKPESLMGKCMGLISAGIDVVGGNLGDSMAETATNYVSSTAQDTTAEALSNTDFKKFFSKKPKTAEEKAAKKKEKELEAIKAQAADDAGVVANGVISLVYSGKVRHDSLKDKITFLKSFVLTEFGVEGSANSVAQSQSPASTSGAAMPSSAPVLVPNEPEEAISDDEDPSPEPIKQHKDHDTWKSLLKEGEILVATAKLNKPNPMGMAKTRQLLMTSSPRLFYVDPKSNNELKGEVEWTASAPPKFNRIDISQFEFVVSSRSYKFEDSDNGSSYWQEHLDLLVNKPAQDKVRADSVNTRNANRAKRREERDAKRAARAKALAEAEARNKSMFSPLMGNSSPAAKPAYTPVATSAEAAAMEKPTTKVAEDSKGGCCVIS